MLDPHDRTSLFEALRPPAGFALDAAVGTSFTVDLEALLTAPIAFALYESSQTEPLEPQEQDDAAAVEPVGLLEAIRRHAERITLFCQAGQIAVPTRRRTVFAWLEDSVVEVHAPRAQRLFHPKVWLVRYRAVDGGALVLRVLCATRNLTFDASWDTLLRIETEPYRPQDTGPMVPGQAALAAFFRQLPELAQHPVAAARARALAGMAHDLEHVPLVPPEPFGDVAFHVLGLDGPQAPPFPGRSTAALVVSPFLGEHFLADLCRDHDVSVLVSREESLDRIAATALEGVARLAVLNPAVDIAPDGLDARSHGFDDSPAHGSAEGLVASERGDPGRRLSGLHAKLFMFDTDEGTRLFTGSANATGAAFDGNVEVLAELRGPTEVGVAAVLADTPGESRLADLLIDYLPLDEPVDPDEVEKLERRLDTLRQEVAAARFTAAVTPAGDEFTLRLASDRPLPAASELAELELAVWPVTLDEVSSSHEVLPGVPPDVAFTVTLEGITAFFALRATARSGAAQASTTFLIIAPLTGAPADRHNRLLAAMLRDRDRLLRYLLMLLHDQGALTEIDEAGVTAGAFGGWLGSGWDELPLMELLLRAVDSHPERLDHIDRLLDDLAGEREDLLPQGWETIWEPIWRHRQSSRPVRRERRA